MLAVSKLVTALRAGKCSVHGISMCVRCTSPGMSSFFVLLFCHASKSNHVCLLIFSLLESWWRMRSWSRIMSRWSPTCWNGSVHQQSSCLISTCQTRCRLSRTKWPLSPSTAHKRSHRSMCSCIVITVTVLCQLAGEPGVRQTVQFYMSEFIIGFDEIGLINEGSCLFLEYATFNASI